MIILSHRGYWKQVDEKNKSIAFERSFRLGFGTETDIRDYKGKLVIAHDIADESAISVEKFFEIYNKYDNTLPLALNIKSDGLQKELKELLVKYKITNYFVFDMSVPDAIQYLVHDIHSFTRQSEYETCPSFYKEAYGVWIDEFKGHWINKDVINDHLDRKKQVCIVSPELHKREYMEEWTEYKTINHFQIMLCTDFPEDANNFFN